MDCAHKTIWRLHKNVMTIALGLSFMSWNVVRCSLDFFERQSKEVIQQHMVIERDLEEAAPVSGSSPDFVLPVCWWIIDLEGVLQLHVSGHLAHFVFLLNKLHRCFSFSVWLFPHNLEWDVKASPALLGLNVMSDWILHRLTITALTAVGMRERKNEKKKTLEMSQNPELSCPFLYKCPENKTRTLSVNNTAKIAWTLSKR